MKRFHMFLAGAGLSMCSLAFAGDMTSADMMKKIDANGDGMISKAEHDAHANMMFEMMDANKDGSVSAAEMDAGHKAMMKGDKPMDHDKMADDDLTQEPKTN